ncbi:hypothetical protein Tco_1402292 [Tanacetum coccineum]
MVLAGVNSKRGKESENGGFGVEIDFARLIWEDIIRKLNKKTREKVIPYPQFISFLLEYMMLAYGNDELTLDPTQVSSVQNWALKPNQPEGPPFIGHMLAICNVEEPIEFKAPKTFSKSKKRVSQGKIPRDQETQSSLAVDTKPNQPLASTPVVVEMHKEDQQGTGGLTSLEATNKEGAYPQLSSDKTKSTGDRLQTTHTNLGINVDSNSNEISRTIKLEDLSKLMQDNQKLEQQKTKPEADVSLLTTQPSYPNVDQLSQLLVNSIKPELSKLLSYYDFSSFIPSELKELSSMIIVLSGEVKELKDHVQGMEIELPRDLK